MSDPADLRRYYEAQDAAATYHEKRFARLPWAIAHEREVAAVAELVSQVKPERILDLATGPGRIAGTVTAPLGIAVDASKAMLSAAADGLPETWRLVRVDAFSLPFPGETFDLVCCFRFLRHHKGKDREKLLSEIRRVLAGGGRLIFDVLNAKMGAFASRFAALDERRIHDEKFTPETLKAEMNEAGFEIESLAPVMRRLRAYHMANIAARHKFLKRARRRLVQLGEKLPSKFPFAWIAVAGKA